LLRKQRKTLGGYFFPHPVEKYLDPVPTYCAAVRLSLQV